MWHELITPDIPVIEKVVRTVVVYLAIALLLRAFGKRELAQLNSFDLVVMLLLSNVVQNSIIGPDNSLAGGLIGAVILLAFNNLLVRFGYRRGRFYEAEPITLARDGKFDLPALKRLGLRLADVEVAIKKQGANSVADTQNVTLEPGGAVVMQLRPEEKQATEADMADLRDRLDRIERLLAR